MATRQLSPKTRVKLDKQGRVLIPAEIREQLGLEPGGTLLMRVEGERLILWTPAAGWRMAQAIASQYAPDRSMVDELIAERRAEAERE